MADAPAGMSPAEHLDHAHRHTSAAGQHADLAASHVKAAMDTLMAPGDGDGDDGSDSSGDGSSDRSMPVVADPPQAGYAQNRTGFNPRSGAARAYRQATGRR
jgi:hypothetical protein